MLTAYYVHHLSPFLIRFGEGFGVRYYGLAYLAGFVLGFYLLKFLARHGYGAPPEAQVADFVFYAALFGVLVGGRLGYVLFYRPEMLTEDPLAIIRVWDGGMASHGGILGVIVYSFVYARRHRLPWAALGDNLVSAAPLGLFCGRIANFINGELYGRATHVPWAMQFPAELLDHPDEAVLALRRCQAVDPRLDSVEAIIRAAQTSEPVRTVLAGVLTPRHPSQLYEAGLEGLVLFALLIVVRWRVRKPDGVVTGLFFIAYALARILGECFREPDAPLTGPLSRGQFLSLFMIGIGLSFWFWAYRQTQRGGAVG